MSTGGTTTGEATYAAPTSTEDRLPRVVAVPLIGLLSLGLWLGVWQLARLIVTH